MNVAQVFLLHLKTEGFRKTNEINLFLLHPNKECISFARGKWGSFNSAVIENE